MQRYAFDFGRPLRALVRVTLKSFFKIFIIRLIVMTCFVITGGYNV